MIRSPTEVVVEAPIETGSAPRGDAVAMRVETEAAPGALRAGKWSAEGVGVEVMAWAMLRPDCDDTVDDVGGGGKPEVKRGVAPEAEPLPLTPPGCLLLDAI